MLKVVYCVRQALGQSSQTASGGGGTPVLQMKTMRLRTECWGQE